MGELLAIGLVAGGAGFIGSMLGLGGGVFLVPILSIAFGIPLESAIAASAIAVVANSTAGSSIYLRSRLTNVRVALLLLVSTTAGALAGGLMAVSLPTIVLKLSFAGLLLAVAGFMARRNRLSRVRRPDEPLPPDPYLLRGSYIDPAVKATVSYVPQGLAGGVPVSAFAGVASGMFGIGGGPITVPVLTLLMRMPMKAAASTSSFMVGLTASASAFIYYANGYVNPRVSVAAVTGIVLGARIGAVVTRHTRPQVLNFIFVWVLVALSISMVLDAVGVL